MKLRMNFVGLNRYETRDYDDFYIAGYEGADNTIFKRKHPSIMTDAFTFYIFYSRKVRFKLNINVKVSYFEQSNPGLNA